MSSNNNHNHIHHQHSNSDSNKRISAVINQSNTTSTPTPTPTPLNLIGANIRPDHEVSLITSSSSSSSISSSTSSTSSSSNPIKINSRTNSPALTVPNINESDDIFLPLQSDSNVDFNFPTNNKSQQDKQHTRRHSRVHSRNLSVFFPRPGQEPFNKPHSPIPSAALTPTQVIEIPNQDHSAPSSSIDQTPSSSSSFNYKSPTTSSQTKGRRGHHHRHSLSHNFFPFLSNAPHSPCPPTPASIPRPVPSSARSHQYHHHHQTQQLPGHRKQSSILKSGLQPIPIILTILTFLIGFRLWITGDVAMIGIGYLVICEALGLSWDLYLSILINRVSQHQDLRYPFGISRFSTLARFTRSVYLLFAAMYVCKESIEHVVLNHSHVHHDHPEIINQVLLVLSMLSIGSSAIVMPEDIGGGHRRYYTIAFSIVLLLSQLFSTQIQQVAIGRIVGLLEVFAFVSLGLQESIKIGKVLLQTSPNEHEFLKEKHALQTGLDFIKENEKKIKKVYPIKLWKLTEEEKLVTYLKLGVNKNSVNGFESIELLSSVRNALIGISDELSIEFVSI